MRGRTILRQTLDWAGLLNDETKAALNRDMGDSTQTPVVDDLYAKLIDMCQQPEPCVKGYGNLGSDDLPPSWPWYTAFGLTDRGRRSADVLMAKHTKYRVS